MKDALCAPAVLAIAAALLLLCAPGQASAEESLPAGGGANAPAPAGSDGLMSRIDFGNAYVMGQTIQSGAVYLLNRKQSDIDSMLSVREHYRSEIREDAERIQAPATRPGDGFRPDQP